MIVGENAQLEQKKIICSSHMTRLHKSCKKLRKVSNWLFLLGYDLGKYLVITCYMYK